MAFKIGKETLKNLPTDPGVYIFKSEKKIIYIGKAKNIKKRVTSYFFKKHLDFKTKILSQTVDEIDFIITSSEIDALILEDTLIKKHKPKFNIQLKDNKTYPYIAIDYNSIYPRVYKTRENRKNNVVYYGPFTDVSLLNSILKIGTDYFSLRTCKIKISENKSKKACLYYHINRCPAYCTLKPDQKEYMENLNKFKMLINGNKKDLINELKVKMGLYANKLEFEKAAKIRDAIFFIEKIKSKAILYFKFKRDVDVIGSFTENQHDYYISILSFREGIATSKKIIKIKNEVFPEETIIQEAILRYYIENQPPSIILTRFKITKDIGKYLSEYYKKNIKIITPKRKALKAIEIAEKNAKHEYLKENIKIKEYNLREVLKLSKEPETIECFDIATIEGKWSVGSSIRFYSYKPDKSNYRAYKLGDFSQSNDYDMIKIALLKRIGSKREMPDLIIVDGGKGHLNAAIEILDFFFIRSDIISIAKSEEIIYTKTEEIKLEKTSEVLKLITRIRDESHRFANKLHDKIRRKRLKSSNLEKIKGIGKKRASILLRKYSSIENILKQDPKSISKETKIPFRIIEELFKTILIKQEKGQ